MLGPCSHIPSTSHKATSVTSHEAALLQRLLSGEHYEIFERRCSKEKVQTLSGQSTWRDLEGAGVQESTGPDQMRMSKTNLGISGST